MAQQPWKKRWKPRREPKLPQIQENDASNSYAYQEKLRQEEAQQQNFTHPEVRPGEEFLMNVTREGFSGIVWKTKRMGDIAYNMSNGTPMSEYGIENYVPVFVKRTELARKCGQ
jgi:hypothetical protein